MSDTQSLTSENTTMTFSCPSCSGAFPSYVALYDHAITCLTIGQWMRFAGSPEAKEEKRKRKSVQRSERRKNDPEYRAQDNARRTATRDRDGEKVKRRERRKTPAGHAAYRREKQREKRGGDKRPFVAFDGEGGYAECRACDCAMYQPVLDTATVDGAECECGHGNADHHSVYTLLRVGDHVLKNADSSALSSVQLLQFLALLPPEPIYVAFSANYDVTMFLRDMPLERVNRLLHSDLRKRVDAHGRVTTFPLDWTTAGVQLEFLAGKQLKIRVMPEVCPDHDPRCRRPECVRNGECLKLFVKGARGKKDTNATHRPVCQICGLWREFNDVFSFFGSSFLSVLKEWGIATREEYRQIKSGKNQRSMFTAVMSEEIEQYNALEIDLLARHMERLRTLFIECGCWPVHWFGPGGVAAGLLTDHNIAKKTELRYWPENTDGEQAELADPFIYRAAHSYYGGRFEVSHFGKIPGPVHNFDINSAYPYAMTQFPCFRHGRWERSTTPQSELYLAYGMFAPTEEARFNKPSYWGLPMRDVDGLIDSPSSGRGTYWSFEIEAARHQEFVYLETWNFIPDCPTDEAERLESPCDVFDWVGELYDQRNRVGKKTPQGLALKLIINSLYGKFAQRIGSSQFNDYVRSSFITATCRAQIMNFIHTLPGCKNGTCGSDVLMIATDGVCTTTLPEGFTPPDKNATPVLGGWDYKRYEQGLFIIQSGMYYFYGERETLKPDDWDYEPEPEERPSSASVVTPKSSKTRGISVAKILRRREEIEELFSEGLAAHDLASVSMTMHYPQFQSLSLANARRKAEIAGEWPLRPHTVSFKCNKRDMDRIEYRDTYAVAPPRKGSNRNESVIYSKGMAIAMDKARNANEAVPAGDWDVPAFPVADESDDTFFIE